MLKVYSCDIYTKPRLDLYLITWRLFGLEILNRQETVLIPDFIAFSPFDRSALFGI